MLVYVVRRSDWDDERVLVTAEQDDTIRVCEPLAFTAQFSTAETVESTKVLKSNPGIRHVSGSSCHHGKGSALSVCVGGGLF